MAFLMTTYSKQDQKKLQLGERIEKKLTEGGGMAKKTNQPQRAVRLLSAACHLLTGICHSGKEGREETYLEELLKYIFPTVHLLPTSHSHCLANFSLLAS